MSRSLVAESSERLLTAETLAEMTPSVVTRSEADYRLEGAVLRGVALGDPSAGWNGPGTTNTISALAVGAKARSRSFAL
ncbi:hypothetical protein N9165_00110 [Akkermansiaceae bacterium]|nr:hypothetical protein [Akkermansiaceae bacterium]